MEEREFDMLFGLKAFVENAARRGARRSFIIICFVQSSRVTFFLYSATNL